jgi:thiol:disulfide interchange protein DsbA
MKPLILSLLTLFAFNTAQAVITEGVDYTVLSKPQAVSNPKSVEVIEFFGYFCPHCKDFDPFISKWATTLPKNTIFRKEHIVWQDNMEAAARMFYVINQMGPARKGAVNTAAFNTMAARQDFNSADVRKTFATSQKLDPVALEKAYSSYAAASYVTRSKKFTKDYNVTGTPAIIVQGKYAVKANSFPEMLRVTDELIQQVSRDLK